MSQTTLKGHLSFSALVVIAVLLASAPGAQAGEWTSGITKRELGFSGPVLGFGFSF